MYLTYNHDTLLRPNPVHTQVYADNSLRSCDAVHEDWHKFGQYLSCGRFHSFNSCVFRESKCFKCGEIGYIQSVCHTTVHSAATNAKICNCDPIKLGVSDDHLSLSATLKSGIESHSRPELGETQNHCETTVFNQLTQQMSHVIVPDMVYLNNSHVFDEVSYESEKNTSSESNHDRQSDAVLIDDNFSDDPLPSNYILNRFEENISEKPNPDVISYFIYPHNALASCGKLVQCKALVLNEFDFD
ncbi:unnamed protein product [Schistosoma margrebowiei]|uniref:Uncharacterized protein n=1 Tax=Schistosoma margrebowiei TaxID=48269 RepID=A0A183LRV0_9TREM|nr:unnamed protein product [Schistosoma margrebowiei]